MDAFVIGRISCGTTKCTPYANYKGALPTSKEHIQTVLFLSFPHFQATSSLSMSERSSSTTRRKTRNSRNQLRAKPPNPISSSHRKVATVSRRLKPRKPIKFDLRRTHSEPVLWTVGFVFDHDDDGKDGSSLGGVFFSPHSCVDIFTPPQNSPFYTNLESYNRDSKVVVNVTVEGSPGPVRTLVKLGASVEDTIKLVVDRYSEEGRSPRLVDENVSLFELHQSHFSLESIDKKDTIGDIGRRSFYLRKSSSGHSGTDDETLKTPVVSVSVFMPNFFARKMCKIGRRMHKLWKVLSCSP